MSIEDPFQSSAKVDLYWLPLGAGDNTHCVRISGRIFEGIAARREHRQSFDLFHSALEVRVRHERFVIEMAPVWSTHDPARGVVGEGCVGLRWLGRSRLFRYEVRCWKHGAIPDLAEAVGSPVRLDTDEVRAERLVALVPEFPRMTWGRDETRAGDMWNSNSLVSWLLASSGHETNDLSPPAHGRAPGWTAGLVAAERSKRQGGAHG